MNTEFAPFVYGLVDPQDMGHVRYVGMTTASDQRPYSHMREARNASAASSHKTHWIRKVQREGREPSVIILEQLSVGCSTDLAGFVEKCYIKSLREIGHRLTNIMEGGGNGPHAQETKAKTSATLMGHAVTKESRRKTAEGLRRYYESPESHEKRSEAAKAAHTEETRAAVRRAQTGRVPEPEMLARRNASIKNAWAARKANGGGSHTEETKAFLSAQTSASMTPERRERQRQAALAAWARKKAQCPS